MEGDESVGYKRIFVGRAFKPWSFYMSAVSGTMSSRTSSSGRLKDDDVTRIGISQYKSACSPPANFIRKDARSLIG